MTFRIPVHKGILMFLFFGLSGVTGSSLNGVVSSSAYLFSRQNSDLETVRHLRLDDSFHLQYRPTRLQNVRVNTSGTFHFDPLTESQEDNGPLNLYAASLRIGNLLSLADLNLGRMFVYDASNSGRIDGIKVTGRLPLKTVLSVYTGGSVASNGTGANPANRHLAGGNLSVPLGPKNKIELAISEKVRARNFYSRNFQTIHVPNVSERRLALRFDRRMGSRYIQIRALQDLQQGKTQEVNVLAGGSILPRLTASLEYHYRHPRIDANSIFSVFDVQGSQEVTLTTGRLLKPDLRLSSRLTALVYSDTTAVRFSLAAQMKSVSIRYNLQDGYGGKFHQVAIDARHRVRSNLSLNATVNVGNYRRPEESPEILATLTGGVTCQPMKTLSVSLEVHSVRNRAYAHDTRLFVQTRYTLR